MPVVISDLDLARAIADAIPTSAQREITPRTLCVLLVLTAKPLTIHELQKALGLAVASASLWVHEAAERGLVSIVADEDDKRRRIVSLTAKGRVWSKDRRAFKRPTDEDQHVDERDAHRDGPADLDAL